MENASPDAEISRLIQLMRNLFKDNNRTSLPVREISWQLNVSAQRIIDVVNHQGNVDFVVSAF